MALIKWRDLSDPWADFKTLQEEINNLFDFDSLPKTTGLFDRSISPSVDVIEGEHNFTLFCELPGIEQKEIDLSIASNVLTIKGKKEDGKAETKGKYFRKESWTGSFQRTLSLPASVDPEKITAELKEGILTVTIPKKEEAKPKQITVNVN